MAQTAQWFNLREFNASLKLLPYNDHRKAKICIVFDDIEQFSKQMEGHATPTDIKAAGFDLETSQHLYQYKGEAPHIHDPFVLYSSNDFDGKIDLKTLRVMFPSIGKQHLEDMEIEHFTDFSWVYPHKRSWNELYENAYNQQFKNVWVIEAPDVPLPDYNPNHPGVFAPVKQRLELLGYDIDSMVTPVFPTQELAERYIKEKGIAQGAAVNRDLSYALPLQINHDSNTIYAIKDIRGITDIIHSDPYSGFDIKSDRDIKNEFRSPMWNLRNNVAYDQVFAKCLETIKPAFEELTAKQALGTDDEQDFLYFQAKAVKAIRELSDNVNDRNNISTNAYVATHLTKYNYDYLREIANIVNEINTGIDGYNFTQYLQEFDNISGLENLVQAMQYATTYSNNSVEEDEFFNQLLAQLAPKSNEAKFDFDTPVAVEDKPEEDSTADAEAINTNDIPESNPKKSSTTASSENRIEDVGEHIGGARKDFYKSYLKVSDLANFNERETATLVTKANIWPGIDYERLKELNFEAKAVTAIKAIKDALPVAPGKEGRRQYRVREGDNEFYIEAISAIRDALLGQFSEDGQECSGAKTFNEVVKRMSELHLTWSPSSVKTYGTGCSPRHSIIGSKACKLIAPEETASFWISSAAKKLYSKQKRAWNESIDYQKWDHLIKETKTKSDEQTAAMQARKELNDLLHNPTPEHLDLIITESKWRNNENVTEHQLLEEFNFKGVEFGNWLPQAERQIIVNHAYDSFCDLAEVLNIPHKNIGLDKNLSLGFGSRGRGGKTAALAHYEPNRHVINLTRLKGAGSLCHEYFHALDDYLGGYKKNYASETSGHPMQTVMSLAKSSHKVAEDALEMSSHKVKQHTSWALSWIQKAFNDREEGEKIIAELNDSIVNTIQPTITQYINETLKENQDSILSTGIYSLVDSDRYSSCKSKCIDQVTNLVNNAIAKSESGTLMLLDKKSKDQFQLNINTVVRNKINETFINKALYQGLSFSDDAFGNTDSKFYSDALKLDEMTGRSKPYWATTKELFARAGAAYVQDKLQEMGKTNQYLVNGSEESAHDRICLHSPNPQAADRFRINKAFDEAFLKVHHILNADNAQNHDKNDVKLSSPSMSM